MSGFKFPKDWDNGLVRGFLDNPRWDGVRKCNQDPGGVNGFGINTSRLSDFTAAYSDFISYAGRYEAGTTSPEDLKKTLVLGIANIHSTGTSDDVVYWSLNGFFSSAYIDGLLALPYFKPISQGGLGNTPVSTTDQDLVVKQLYEAGMWIWRNGNLPPITVSCLVNFQFDDDYCYDTGAGPMLNQPGYASSGVTGSVNGTTTNMYGVKDEGIMVPWMGTWTNDGNGYINIAQTIAPTSSGITHEWTGKRNDTSGNEYISDARNGSGTWLLTEYNGYDFNWSNQLQVNNSNGYANRHWGCMTADNSAGVSKMYYGSSGSATWDGEIGTGTVTATMVGVGADFRIGTRYTDSARWNGYMGMYRIWDGALTATQAEICWLHERYKIHTPYNQ